MAINEYVNPNIFPFSNHKLLLMHLLHISNTDDKQAKWLKCSKSNKTPTIIVNVVSQYTKLTKSKTAEVCKLLAGDDIIQMGYDIGLQKEEMANLKKALKNRKNGSS